MADKEFINKRYIQARMNLANDSSHPDLIGFGTVIIENCLVIKNVRLYEGKEGAFVSFPQRKTEQGYRPYIKCEGMLLEEIMAAMMLDLAYQEVRSLGIAEISIRMINKKGLLAIATVEFTMGLTIMDIKILEGMYGPMVILPEYQGKDLVYPLGRKQRKALNEAILEKYRATK